MIAPFFRRHLRIISQLHAAACLLLCVCIQTPVAAAEIEKIPLLVRELRNDQGEIIPVKDDIRQLFLYFEREANVSFEVRYYPMTRLLNNVKNGEGIAFGLSKNSERLESMQFSDFIYANYVWLVTPRTRQFTFNHIDDLKGKTVGVIRGVSYGDEFDQRKNEAFRVEEDTASHVARLKKLSMRRMDVMLFGARQADPNEVHALLRHMQGVDKSHVLDASEIDFTVLNKPLRVDELHFAAPLNKHGELIKRLNLAIARGKKTGEITRILSPVK
ncbi:substrate-binding periplasmic protein [Undibacterium flavidum]|nr:transporter substrate-binding domain-containing protein [Undibacterium flavidum]